LLQGQGDDPLEVELHRLRSLGQSAASPSELAAAALLEEAAEKAQEATQKSLYEGKQNFY